MLERRSAIAGLLAAGGRNGADGRRALTLGEMRGWSLVQVAGFRSTMPAVEKTLGAVIGTALPATIAETRSGNGLLILRTGPEQLWIVGREGDGLEHQLGVAISASQGAVTPLSHSRTRLFIEGDPARDVLAKGVPADFHPDVFPVGALAMTGIHHTPVVVMRSGESRYEIWALRTFGAAVWEWLTDAALEYGYEVAAG